MLSPLPSGLVLSFGGLIIDLRGQEDSIRNDKRIDGGKMLVISKDGERLYDTDDYPDSASLLSLLKNQGPRMSER